MSKETQQNETVDLAEKVKMVLLDLDLPIEEKGAVIKMDNLPVVQRNLRQFQRLHGKADYSGSGVGLSIARKIVENRQGYIWATSQQGSSSAFSILLPAVVQS